MKRAAAFLAFAAVAGAAHSEPRFVPAGPSAPFSAAVQVGEVLYLSGQIGNRPDGSYPVGMAAQGRQAMDNVATILKGQGLSMDAVFKCTVFLSDMSQWGEFNKVYVTYFDPKRLPARSALGANGLAAGSMIEVECWAHAAAPKN